MGNSLKKGCRAGFALLFPSSILLLKAGILKLSLHPLVLRARNTPDSVEGKAGGGLGTMFKHNRLTCHDHKLWQERSTSCPLLFQAIGT